MEKDKMSIDKKSRGLPSGASAALAILAVAAVSAASGYILSLVGPVLEGVVRAMADIGLPAAKEGAEAAVSAWSYVFFALKWIFYSLAAAFLSPVVGFLLGKAIGLATSLGFRGAGWKGASKGASKGAALSGALSVLAGGAALSIAFPATAALSVGALALSAASVLVMSFVAAVSSRSAISEEKARGYLTNAKIAFRNLSRHKKATFLLGGVIGFGIMIISLMQGCAGSLMGNVSSNFANMMGGHIFVSGTEKLPSGKEYTIIRDDSLLLDALKASGVETKSVSKLAEFQATLVFEGNSTMQAVLGVDFDRDSFITERLVVAEGSFQNMSDEKGIIVSETMAKALRARQGDRILAQLRTFSGQQNLGEFTIAAVVKDAGLFSLASMSAYANISYVNELLNLPPGSYQTLSFYLPDMRKLDAMGLAYYASLKERAPVFERKNASDERADMMARLRGGKVETWEGVRYKMQTLNDRLSGLQDLVNGINVASYIALIVLFLVIMVGISNTFRMIMLDRIKEVGTMRALGMQREDVLTLFLDEAVFLSLGGALAGLALALLVMLGFSLIDFGLGSFLSLILRNGHLTFNLKPLIVLANVFIIGALTLVAALFPARAAAALEPAHALRTSK